jgi:hypothetical protein
MWNPVISLHNSHTAVSLVHNTIIWRAFKVISCIKLRCSKATRHFRLMLQTDYNVLRHTTTPDTCIKSKYTVILDESWLML